MADFFGINNMLELLGFRTAPIRTYDGFTTRASGEATSAAATKGGAKAGETAPVKTFDEFLAEAKDTTAAMSLEEFKDYVNTVLAQLQAENAQRTDVSATTLQNQMQLSNLYASLLQNSLLTGDTYTNIANAVTNAQQIIPTASTEGDLTASLAASLLNLSSASN